MLVTNLELEPVAHLEPANFWIGPSAVSLQIRLIFLSDVVDIHYGDVVFRPT